nr:hypothetical protein [Pandoravirus massiliensis]
MSSTVGSASYRRNRRRSVPQGGSLRPVQEVTFGLPVLEGAGTPEQTGFLLGRGADANASVKGEDRKLYNNKNQIVITQRVADALNAFSQRDRNAVAEAAAQGVILSNGLGGPQGPDGRFEFYLPNVTQYYQDDMAVLYVPSSQLDRAIGLVVPGSFRQLEALEAGVPAGQVRVKSPLNTTGYLKVGSKGWLDMIRAAAAGKTQASREAIENAIGQGALYGLAQVFSNNGVNVVPYDGGNNNVRFALAPGTTIQSLGRNSKFAKDVSNWYSIYGIDPADQSKGAVGAATLKLKHADKIVGPNGETDLADINRLVTQEFQETGSTSGFSWRDGYKLPSQRRGLTAFPLRDEFDNPLTDPTNPNGKCAGIIGSGPGVTGSGRADARDAYGLRLYVKTKKHVGTGVNDAGVESAPTFSCAFTSSNVVNPNRQVYQRGGARASANQSLIEQLAQRNELLNATLPANMQDIYSPDTLSARYVNWLQNPQLTEGTDPFFMVPGGIGRGFSVGAPSQWESVMPPEDAALLANTDLQASFKAQEANALLDRLLNPEAAANVMDFRKGITVGGAANPLQGFGLGGGGANPLLGYGFGNTANPLFGQ